MKTLSRNRLFLYSLLVLHTGLSHAKSSGLAELNLNAPNSTALLGILDYKGGLQDLAVEFSPRVINSFQLRIPGSCGLDVLDVQASIEGVMVTTSASDPNKHIYSVNGGSGSIVDRISLSFNAAENLYCKVPVYLIEPASASPQPAAPTLLPGRYAQEEDYYDVRINAQGVIAVEVIDHAFPPERFYPTGDRITFTGHDSVHGHPIKLIVTRADSFKISIDGDWCSFYRTN